MPTDQCLEGHGYSPGQGASLQGAAPTLRCHSADACLGGTRRVSKRWFLCLSYNNRLHAQVILIQIGDCRWPRFWRQLDLCEICATSRRTSYVSRSSASKVTFAGSCDHSSLDRTELCAKEENVTDGSLAPRSRLQRSGLSSAQRGSPAKGSHCVSAVQARGGRLLEVFGVGVDQSRSLQIFQGHSHSCEHELWIHGKH